MNGVASDHKVIKTRKGSRGKTLHDWPRNQQCKAK